MQHSSERRCQLVADLEGILSAFEALDAREELPDIFCEATDLLKLPPICLDPVSEKLHDTTMSLESLASDVKSLQEELSNSLTSLKADLQNVKSQMQNITPGIVSTADPSSSEKNSRMSRSRGIASRKPDVSR